MSSERPSGAITRLCTAGTDVSAHYIVLEDGRIVQCVPEAKRAWHAGLGTWAGETDINSCSIGIEIINRGHDWGYPDFPRRQIAAVIALCRGIMLRHGLPAARVLGHSDVAPARKKDPGEKFPWHSLANSGVGHWVLPAPVVRGETIKFGAEGDDVLALQHALARYGYGIEATAKYDTQTMEVVTAFQRHFRPERVDGVTDHSTLVTLQTLLGSLPGEFGKPPRKESSQWRALRHGHCGVISLPRLAAHRQAHALGGAGDQHGFRPRQIQRAQADLLHGRRTAPHRIDAAEIEQ
eukprot:gene6812-9198_t